LLCSSPYARASRLEKKKHSREDDGSAKKNTEKTAKKLESTFVDAHVEPRNDTSETKKENHVVKWPCGGEQAGRNPGDEEGKRNKWEKSKLDNNRRRHCLSKLEKS